MLHRRKDNFHEVASLIQAIDLGDFITFERAEHCDTLSCSDNRLSVDSSNLILKAAEIFRRKTSLHTYLKIHLEKHIPWEAGLGGGSSNAATTLWAINKLCGSPASMEELALWGAEIGSDVPFFFSLGTAYCTGRGEIISQQEKVPLLHPLWLVIPEKGLSTPEVFSQLKYEKFCSKDPKTLLNGFLSGFPDFINDLESAAFTIFPRLGGLKKSLYGMGFEKVLMTGSGTTLFCIGEGNFPKLFRERVLSAYFCNREEDHWYVETKQEEVKVFT